MRAVRWMWALVCACAVAFGSGCGGAQHSGLASGDLRGGKVLTTTSGVQVEIAEIQGGRALLRFSGTGAELDGLVLAYERGEISNGFAYRTELHGRELWPVHRIHASGLDRWHLYGPGLGRDGQPATLDAERSRALDPSDLLEAHEDQLASGRLQAMQAFDRPAEEGKIQTQLERERDRMADRCGAKPAVTLAWEAFTDEQILDGKVRTYCENIFGQLRNLCEQTAAARDYARGLASVRCARADTPGVAREGDALVFRVEFATSNHHQIARDGLKALDSGGGLTLGAAMLRERTIACAAEGGQIVLAAPREAEHPGVSYFDGQALMHLGEARSLGTEWFFEPRQFNPKAKKSFLGHDMRYFSRLDADVPAGRCDLVCGERRIPLRLLDAEPKAAFLETTTYAPRPFQREPYVVARDRRGTYYYVDRGTTPDTRRDYRVYLGPRGAMKLQKMKDIVSDSEGEIFATRGGSLRLIVGKKEALWISGGSKRELQVLAPEENWGLVYGDLGVYMAERMGSPCEDL